MKRRPGPSPAGRSPSLRQRLLFNFKLLKRHFFIGYEGDYRQAKVNDIKYHRYTNAAVLGWQW